MSERACKCGGFTDAGLGCYVHAETCEEGSIDFYENHVLAVECPRCAAPKGRPCTDPRGETTRPDGRIVWTHRPRRERAERHARAS